MGDGHSRHRHHRQPDRSPDPPASPAARPASAGRAAALTMAMHVPGSQHPALVPPACAAGGTSLRPSGIPTRRDHRHSTTKETRSNMTRSAQSMTPDQSRPVYVASEEIRYLIRGEATRCPRGRRFLAGQCTALTWPYRGRCAGSTGRSCITGQYSTSRATTGLIARSVQMRSQAADESACKPGSVAHPRVHGRPSI